MEISCRAGRTWDQFTPFDMLMKSVNILAATWLSVKKPKAKRRVGNGVEVIAHQGLVGSGKVAFGVGDVVIHHLKNELIGFKTYTRPAQAAPRKHR